MERQSGWEGSDRRRPRPTGESIERLAKPDVLHAAFEVRQAVFEGEAVIEGARVRHAGTRRLGRKAETKIAGDRNGTQISQRPRDVREAPDAALATSSARAAGKPLCRTMWGESNAPGGPGAGVDFS